MKLPSLAPLLACLLGCGCHTAAVHGAESDPGRVLFNRDIRCSLSDAVYKCNGPDASARQAHLRLDLPSGATADLGGRAAIVPGHPDKSELVRRIRSSDPEEQMPPPDSHKKLDARQIEL